MKETEIKMNLTLLRDDIVKSLNIKGGETFTQALLRVVSGESSEIFFEQYLELINHDTEADYLKDIYETFYSNREELNQDYTPQSISRLISKYALRIFSNRNKKINTVFDLCCGSGSLSIEFWKLQKDTVFYMLELDMDSIAILLANLCLRGMNADVIHGNGLSFDFYKVFQVRNAGKYSIVNEIDAGQYKLPACDIAISNPPFNVSFKDKKDYSKYCGYKQTAKANALFAIRCLEQVKEDGQVFFINSAGMRQHTDSTKCFRQYCVENKILKGIIKLPKNMFIHTPLPFEIWIFDKVKKNDDIYWLDNENTNLTKNYFELAKNTKYGCLHMANRLYKSIRHFNGFTDEQIQIIIDTMESGQTEKEKYLKRIHPNEINSGSYVFDFEFKDPPKVIPPPQDILEQYREHYLDADRQLQICIEILKLIEKPKKGDIFDSAIAYLEELEEAKQHQ